MTLTKLYKDAAECGVTIMRCASMAVLSGRPDSDATADRVQAIKAFLALVEAMKAIRAAEPEEWAVAVDETRMAREIAGRAAA